MVRTFRSAALCLLLPFVVGPCASLRAAEPAPAREVPAANDSFTVGDRRIPVWRYEPQAPGKYPAVIVLPGVDGIDKDTAPLYEAQAKIFAGKGYAVLIVDYLAGTDTGKEALKTVRERFRGFYAPGAVLKPADLDYMAKHFEDWTGVG